MSKARQLINGDSSPAPANLIQFEPLSAPHQEQSSAKLRAEIQALRLELAKAQRTIAHYETLLNNALVREHEIRSAMGKRTW